MDGQHEDRRTEPSPERTVRELRIGETHLAHRAMRALRPHFADANIFVERVDSLQRPEGYRLAACFARDHDQAVAVAGFRMGHSLSWGHYLYVDDLSTAPEARRSGHAGAVLEWLFREARESGCEQFHLDSGCNPERFDAHRLYYLNRLAITAHHFSLKL